MKMSKVQLSDELVEHLLPIETSVLLAGFHGAKHDMAVCRLAMRVKILTYGDGKSTLHRLISDCRQIAVMRAELARRGVNIIAWTT